MNDAIDRGRECYADWVPHKVFVLRRCLEMQRDRCAYCLRLLLAGKATLDHVIPKAAGGKSNYWNLVAACEPCNIAKGLMDAYLFHGLVAQFGPTRARGKAETLNRQLHYQYRLRMKNRESPPKTKGALDADRRQE